MRMQAMRSKFSSSKISEDDSISDNEEELKEPGSRDRKRIKHIKQNSKHLHMYLESNSSKHTFESKYKLGDKIGEGLHSSVYKCVDIESQQTLAVKITREDDSEKKLAHKNEFELTKSMDHPNIVKSVSFYENLFKGEVFLVMEYARGRDLSEIGVLPESEVKAVVKQILMAVSYLHENSVVHRDIKPDNILYDGKTVSLLDFNVSRKFNTVKLMTQTGLP